MMMMMSTDKRAAFEGPTEVPWPASHAALTASGVPYFEAVKALNQTSGDLAAAKKMLDLSL